MLVYRFNFDARYVGYAATITDADGVEVAGSPVTLDAAGDGSIQIAAEGHYRASIYNGAGPYGDGYSVVDCVLDLPASIAAGGGVESVRFVMTGSGTTDETDDPATVTVDPASALPSWLSLAGDVLTIEQPIQIGGGAVGAFTANFPTTIPGGGDGYVAMFCDAYLSSGQGSAWFGTDYFEGGVSPADLDVTSEPHIGSAAFVPVGTTITFAFQGQAYESDGTTAITDGTYEGTAYFELRAEAFAPALPA